MTPESIEGIARYILDQRTQKKSEPITILVFGCESGKVLSDLQVLVPNCRIDGVFENDSNYLLAERFLKNSQSIQALAPDTLDLLSKHQRKFDIVIGLSQIDNDRSIVPFLQAARKFLKNGGLSIALRVESSAEFHTTARAEGFELLHSDLAKFLVFRKARSLDT